MWIERQHHCGRAGASSKADKLRKDPLVAAVDAVEIANRNVPAPMRLRSFESPLDDHLVLPGLQNG
jgi:hypothetical protein